MTPACSLESLTHNNPRSKKCRIEPPTCASGSHIHFYTRFSPRPACGASRYDLSRFQPDDRFKNPLDGSIRGCRIADGDVTCIRASPHGGWATDFTANRICLHVTTALCAAAAVLQSVQHPARKTQKEYYVGSRNVSLITTGETDLAGRHLSEKFCAKVLCQLE